MHYIHALCIFKLSITVSDLNIGQFLTLFSDFKRPVIYYLIFLMIFYLYIFMFKLKFWSELTFCTTRFFEPWILGCEWAPHSQVMCFL